MMQSRSGVYPVTYGICRKWLDRLSDYVQYPVSHGIFQSIGYIFTKIKGTWVALLLPITCITKHDGIHLGKG